MLRRQEILLVVPILILATAPQLAARAEGPPPAAGELVPAQAVIVLNVSKPKAVWDMFLQPKVIEAVESSPAYRAGVAEPGFRQFQAVVKLLERRLNADWKTIIRRLTGGGMTWAVGPGGGNLLIVDALDAEVPKGLHDFLLFMVEADAAKRKQTGRVRSVKHGDVTIWSFGPKQAHAVIGKRWMVASHVEVLKTALNLRDRSGGKSIASMPVYRQAMKAAGSDAAAALYVNTGVLKQLPKVAKALASRKNPLLALLAGPLTEAFSKSSWLSLSLKIKGDALTIDAVFDGAIASSGAAKFALAPKAGDGAMGNLAVPRRIAAMSLYRDLGGFYAAKDTLFPERTSGLIFFENMMDALGKEVAGSVKPKAGTHSLVELDGAQLGSILSANRENMIRGNMVDKGNTREQAESEINSLLTVIKYIKRVGLALGVDKGRSKISLHVQLNLPAGAKGGK